MKKKNLKLLFNLQMFADGGEGGEVGGTGAEGAEGAEGGDDGKGGEAGTEQKNQPKYTDDDLDRIIGAKFAKWQKEQEKKISEAERLSKMTADEKNAAELKALRDEINGYKEAAARSEMTKQARAILSDKNIHVDDALLANLISDNAENTKASVENFVALFNAAVDKAVKEALKGDTPRKGNPAGGITKEQILAVKDRAERQRLINENLHLFQ